MKRRAKRSATLFISSASYAEPKLLFSAADDHQHNPTGDGKGAKERGKRDGMRFGVTDLQRPEVDIFLPFLEAESSIG